MTKPHPITRLAQAANRHCVTVKDIKGPSRSRTISRAREDAWGMLRDDGWSLPEIASLTGHHHTSVLKALARERKA